MHALVGADNSKSDCSTHRAVTCTTENDC